MAGKQDKWLTWEKKSKKVLITLFTLPKKRRDALVYWINDILIRKSCMTSWTCTSELFNIKSRIYLFQFTMSFAVKENIVMKLVHICEDIPRCVWSVQPALDLSGNYSHTP